MSPSDPDGRATHILFVCLGNICRSPLAEGIFLDLVAREGVAESFHVDSAGTGAWHAGEPPDPRSVEVAARNEVRLCGTARQVVESDFHEFDLIVAMDHDNLGNLTRLKERSGGGARLVLLREFDPEAGDDLAVPDPYYGGRDGFDQVYRMVHRSCARLLETVRTDPHDGHESSEGGPS